MIAVNVKYTSQPEVGFSIESDESVQVESSVFVMFSRHTDVWTPRSKSSNQSSQDMLFIKITAWICQKDSLRLNAECHTKVALEGGGIILPLPPGALEPGIYIKTENFFSTNQIFFSKIFFDQSKFEKRVRLGHKLTNQK